MFHSFQTFSNTWTESEQSPIVFDPYIICMKKTEQNIKLILAIEAKLTTSLSSCSCTVWSEAASAAASLARWLAKCSAEVWGKISGSFNSDYYRAFDVKSTRDFKIYSNVDFKKLRVYNVISFPWTICSMLLPWSTGINLYQLPHLYRT